MSAKIVESLEPHEDGNGTKLGVAAAKAFLAFIGRNFWPIISVLIVVGPATLGMIFEIHDGRTYRADKEKETNAQNAVIYNEIAERKKLEDRQREDNRRLEERESAHYEKIMDALVNMRLDLRGVRQTTDQVNASWKRQGFIPK